MTQNAASDLLYLLVPWELPIQTQLSEASQTQVSQAIKLLLQALDLNSEAEAIAIVSHTLANLELTDICPVQISSTNTPLKPSEVEDYNQYFNVVHGSSKQPEICLVKSILLAYKTFLELQQQSLLNSTQVDIQKQGFKVYAYLLARIFNLSLEVSS